MKAILNYIDENCIDVDWVPLRQAPSLSMPVGSKYCIAINTRQLTGEADERTKLAHEVGHCATGAFYNRYSSLDILQKHENRADKWAIRHLIPVESLDAAVADGYCEICDLAEHFGVSEDFMKKAVCLYTHGNLAAELYF